MAMTINKTVNNYICKIVKFYININSPVPLSFDFTYVTPCNILLDYSLDWYFFLAIGLLLLLSLMPFDDR